MLLPPAPNKKTIEDAVRRLREELGYGAISLEEQFVFTYKATYANGLTEYEIDHVLVGFTDAEPSCADPEEVAEFRWVSLDALSREVRESPQRSTVWFREILSRL